MKYKGFRLFLASFFIVLIFTFCVGFNVDIVESKKTTNDDYIIEIVNLTNSYRKELGINELEYDSSLSRCADIRAKEIALYDKFDHIRPNGLSFSSILVENNIDYEITGENIAYGYSNYEDVSLAWKNSEGHYENIINSNYTKIGIGYYEYNGTKYWTQIFTN